MMARQRLLIATILGLAIAAIVVITQLPTQLGLDLRGGTQLTLQVQPTEKIPNISNQDMEAVQSVISGRVNELGVSETSVQLLGQNQLLVELPGVSDPEQARRVLGETAQLEFRSQRQGTEEQLRTESQVLQGHQVELIELQLQREAASATFQTDTGDSEAASEETASSEAAVPEDLDEQIAVAQEKVRESTEAVVALFEPALVTGESLTNAIAQPIGNSSAWEVQLRFDAQGAENFAEISRIVAGTGRSIGIFLDNRLISAPTVDVRYAETGIAGGEASISGGFDVDSATELAIQLRGGALPLPVEVAETRTVGPTLGQDSI
ncbi:MAG: protein translocase subunit SecD, partial [Cyanobacteria bacterium J06626_18]